MGPNSNKVSTVPPQNLTLKTLAGFRWAQTFCPSAQHVLKVDDDMFVQVPRLLALAKGLGMKAKMAKALQPKELIVGNVASGWKPVRNPQSKVTWFLFRKSMIL